MYTHIGIYFKESDDIRRFPFSPDTIKSTRSRFLTSGRENMKLEILETHFRIRPIGRWRPSSYPAIRRAITRVIRRSSHLGNDTCISTDGNFCRRMKSSKWSLHKEPSKALRDATNGNPRGSLAREAENIASRFLHVWSERAKRNDDVSAVLTAIIPSDIQDQSKVCLITKKYVYWS